MRKITIKDIAEMASVSKSTVSRALKNHPDISPMVKDKIKQLAESFHFVPNAAAVGLRQKSVKTIGLILPGIHHFFVPAVIEGISATLKSKQYKLMILISDDEYEKEVQNIITCIDSNVDGILISLTKMTSGLDHLDKLSDFQIPLVLLDKTIDQQKFSEVKIDDYQAGKECCTFLIKEGVREIIGFFGPESLQITKERMLGFKSVLNNAPEIRTHYYYCDSSGDAREKCLSALRLHGEADAVFAMSDEVLVGVNAALQSFRRDKHHLSLKTVAISEGYLPEFMFPPVSHLVHNGYELGQSAAQLLLDHITHPEKKPEKRFLLTNFSVYP